jgi:hypothetical protein
MFYVIMVINIKGLSQQFTYKSKIELKQKYKVE